MVFRSYFHRLFDDRHGEIFQLNARQARAFLERYRAELTLRQQFCLWLASGLSLRLPPLQRTIYRVLRLL